MLRTRRAKQPKSKILQNPRRAGASGVFYCKFALCNTFFYSLILAAVSSSLWHWCFCFCLAQSKYLGMARSAAKVIKQVKNATNDIKREILDNAEDNALTDVKKTVEEGRDAFKEVTDTIKRGTKL